MSSHGTVNLAAPGPLPNGEFMRLLREAWGTRIGLPATRWMIELGTWLLRTESELVLKSRRVVPGRSAGVGVHVPLPLLGGSVRSISCRRWRQSASSRRRSSSRTASHLSRAILSVYPSSMDLIESRSIFSPATGLHPPRRLRLDLQSVRRLHLRLHLLLCRVPPPEPPARRGLGEVALRQEERRRAGREASAESRRAGRVPVERHRSLPARGAKPLPDARHPRSARRRINRA